MSVEPAPELPEFYAWTRVQEDDTGLTERMRVPGGYFYRSAAYSRGAQPAAVMGFYVPLSEVLSDADADADAPKPSA
jgi:hypothetical protein